MPLSQGSQTRGAWLSDCTALVIIINFKILHGLSIRTPYNQHDLVIQAGLSPCNQAFGDLVIWTAEKIQSVLPGPWPKN